MDGRVAHAIGSEATAAPGRKDGHAQPVFTAMTIERRPSERQRRACGWPVSRWPHWPVTGIVQTTGDRIDVALDAVNGLRKRSDEMIRGLNMHPILTTHVESFRPASKPPAGRDRKTYDLTV